MKRSKGRPVRPVMESRGKVAHAEWIAAGHTQTELAKILGYSQPLIAQWLDGTVRPTSADREVLERIGICPADDWLTPSERVRMNDIAAKVG